MAILTLSRSSCRPVYPGRVSFFSLMSLARQRRALASLTQAQLDDLGLTRDQAMGESRRPFWDIPIQWNSCR